MNDQSPSQTRRTNATVRRSRWPGWIWAVPIAALLLVGWWALRALTRGGEDITISFDNAHGLKEGDARVVYRGLQVGKVTGIALAKNGDAIDVAVHVEDSVAKFLTSGTQFWLRGADPSLTDLSSLTAVLAGPTIVMEPAPGKPATHFTGLTRKPIISGPHHRPQIYEVSFDGSVGELKQGDPVKLRGFTVGEVKDVGFRYSASTGELATPVTLALYPSLFHIGGASVARDDKAALTAAIDRLVQEGLRARLERQPPLVGSLQVTLELVPGSSDTVPAIVNGVTQIPTLPGSGLDSVINRVNNVPIDQIAQNLLDISHHLDALVSSPRLDDAIVQLDAALKQIRQTADNAGRKIPELVDSLRTTARRLDDAAKAADKVLGGTPSQSGTQQAMREITEAARSVRDLANYLDRHPEALIRGRTP